jgi:hypothetical protein
MRKAVVLLFMAVFVLTAVPVFAGGESPQAIFYSLDVNHDGRIVKEELCALYPDKAVCERKFIIFDQNGDGFIVIREFVAAYE